MNSLVQPNALKVLLRSLKDRLAGHSQEKLVAAPEAGPDSVERLQHLPFEEQFNAGGRQPAFVSERPNEDGSVIDALGAAACEAAASPSAIYAAPDTVHASAPARYEVGADNAAFASVFSLGDERIPTTAYPIDETLATAACHLLVSPIDLDSLEDLDRELALLDKFAPALDFAASRRAKFKPRDMNDLVIIKGIGPKSLALLNQAGIHSFADLSECTGHGLQKILEREGSRHRLARPAQWIEQARLAASNQWQALQDWQAAQRKLRKEIAKKG